MGGYSIFFRDERQVRARIALEIDLHRSLSDPHRKLGCIRRIGMLESKLPQSDAERLLLASN